MTRTVLAVALLASFTAGCGKERPVVLGRGDAVDPATCTLCHGDPASGNFAPPRGANGETATSAPAVGAHQRHLAAGQLRGPVPCGECHVQPRDLQHARQPLRLTFGPLATAGGWQASFDSAALTCANYCHGATLGGGSLTRPVWNVVDGTQSACGTCHGVPPPLPHPAVSNRAACVHCHAGTVRPDGAIDLVGGGHLDGTVQLDGTGGDCTGCHGDPARAPTALRAAPPVDTAGNRDTTAPGVGAHQAHLLAGRLRGPVPCTECHAVPTDVAHASQPLQLTFGPLARAGQAAASFDAARLTCVSYCHGATLSGGSHPLPVWNQVDGSQAPCGACHGLPPPAPHPRAASLQACHDCHAGTVKDDGTLDLAGGLHLDGVVQLAGSGGACTGCHGDPARTPAALAPAPPADTRGQTATSAPGVGAHQAHLQDGPLRGALRCDDCHAVPASLTHASQPLDLTWGALARADGATPGFDASRLTCASYCHGATLGGGSLTAPLWNRVDGTQAACGTCHGLPPPRPHPTVNNPAACPVCHAGTLKPDGTVDVAGGLHVNGAVDVAGAGACTACHGDPARQPPEIAAAPPLDTFGNSDPSAPGVGAHLRHLQGGAVRGPLACADCHAVPSDLAHSGQPLDLTWGALARTRQVAPAFDAQQLRCTSYCHGAALGGGSLTAPRWTQVDGTQVACGTCHGLPPPAPHPAATPATCTRCHPGTVKADGTLDLAGGLHVNGAVDVSLAGACTACHGDPARQPADIAPAPPLDTLGGSDTTSPGVGAHQSHLAKTNLRTSPLPCSECHALPNTFEHAAQPLQLTWGPIAKGFGTSPTFDSAGHTCTNWCHQGSAPTWTGAFPATGTSLSCTSCHGQPPASGHHSLHTVQGIGVNLGCGCHPASGPAQGNFNPAIHVNGTRDLRTDAFIGWDPAGRTCTNQCHDVPSPPW